MNIENIPTETTERARTNVMVLSSGGMVVTFMAHVSDDTSASWG